ncbi:MAG: hypothetical protein ACK4UN_08510 [Limisphaerales bacterium]
MIPFCKSEYLQDFTIALGLRSDLRRRWAPFFEASVDTLEMDDGPLEGLWIWVDSYYYTRVSFGLFEDRTMFVSIALLPTANHSGYKVSFETQADHLTFEQIVDALDSTVTVATRLCYRECPLPLLRRFWRYEGEVEITGSLK